MLYFIASCVTCSVVAGWNWANASRYVIDVLCLCRAQVVAKSFCQLFSTHHTLQWMQALTELMLFQPSISLTFVDRLRATSLLHLQKVRCKSPQSGVVEHPQPAAVLSQARSQLHCVSGYLGHDPSLLTHVLSRTNPQFTVEGFIVRPPNGHCSRHRQLLLLNGQRIEAPMVARHDGFRLPGLRGC